MAVAGQGLLTKRVCALTVHTLLLLCLSLLMDRMDLCVFQCRKSRIFYPVSGAERDSCMISCADPNMAYKVNKSYFQLFSDNTRCANSHKRLFLLMCYVRLSFPPTLSIRAQGKRWTGYPPTDWTALRHKASRQCRISFPKSAAQEPEQ
jgi:hypothetical protein